MKIYLEKCIYKKERYTYNIVIMAWGINLICNKQDNIYNNIHTYKDNAISMFLISFVIIEIEK